MDVIYGLATLIIVVLYGEGAYDELPGVRASSRPSAEGPFFVNGVWLQKAPPPDELGFTPADHPVNRGLTLFRNSVFNFDHEGIHVPKADPESFNRMYQSLVSDYGKRELTYDGDALAAIEGILAPIQLTSGFGFTWALPKSFLGVAITWSTDHNVSSVRRRKATYTIATKHDTIQVPYPSWSWIGWIGPNLFDDLFGSLVGEHAGLEFYMLDGEKNWLVLIEENQSFIQMESSNKPHRRAPPTWREDAIREASMEHVPSSLLVPELRPRENETRRGGRNGEGERYEGGYYEEYEDESEDEDDEVPKRVQLLREHRGNTVTAVWDHPNHMATASDEAELIVVGRGSFEYARSRSELIAYMAEKQPAGARIRVGGATVAEE
ncbi:hypothetical protein CSAL01_07192 [Colletotrichum salicis]|uniref:Uncharacterized protein n=1 Tax=Colletotrichum salicis TaxID=1209931 RepID=A0A135T8F6_9PEZI|nr:hypothetical protein CSAL01_07192 [Colletotrichum salicis]